MNQGAKFWILMAIFQVVFGLSIFAITRQHYIDNPHNERASESIAREPAFEWVDRIADTQPAILESQGSGASALNDPVEISRLADENFANKQYARAANLYRQLLTFDPRNVVVHNNLGITLHYLGRSTEALRVLTDGVAVDSRHQRIWLTLGYVNSQLGNIEEARTSLTTAVEMDPNSQIGQSAATMLANLPQ